MPDIEATIGLDARQFHSGLHGVEKSVKGFAKLFKGFLGVEVARQAFGAMKGAVEEFAKTNEDARKSVELWDQSVSAVKSGVGEVLSGAFATAAEALDALTGGAGSARVAEEASKKQMETLQAQVKAAEDLKKKSAEKRADMEFELELERERVQLDAMRRAGNEEDAAFIQADLDIAKQLRDIARDENLTLNDKLRLEGELKRTAAARQVEAVNKVRQEKTDQANKFNRGFDAEFAKVDATIQAINGEKQLAALTEIRLEYEQKIADVRDQKAISEEEKERRITQLAGQRERLLKATVAEQIKEAQDAVTSATSKSGNFRTSEAGLGFAGGLGARGLAVSAAANDPVKKAIENLKKTQEVGNGYLKQIADKAGAGGVAVFG